MFHGKNIVLGITGSISAYKGAELLSILRKKGAEVRIIMTESATKFVQPLTFATLSGRPVMKEMFSLDGAYDVQHIELAKWADMIIIAPATANIIGKIANGIADDLLTATILASRIKVMIAPAMNTNMITNPIYLENCNKLKKMGFEFIESEIGLLACGDVGPGRLANTENIMKKMSSWLERYNDYCGKTILITASCTREPIDNVRFISNYSTGKMGFALAKNAIDRGARVILISGPSQEPPIKAHIMKSIETAEQMKQEVFKYFPEADIVISAAAVADFRPKKSIFGKIKKDNQEMFHIELEKNSDILAELGEKKGNKILVGFAAEAENLVENAKEKMNKKNLDLIVANDIMEKNTGFASEMNCGKIIDKSGIIKDLPTMKKSEMAKNILDEILKIK